MKKPRQKILYIYAILSILINSSVFMYGTKLQTALQNIIKQYNIKTIIHAPCSTFNTIQNALNQSPLEQYIGIDSSIAVIKEKREQHTNTVYHFVNGNVATDPLPTADLIIYNENPARLHYDGAQKMFLNLKQTQSKYLLCSTWPTLEKNPEILVPYKTNPINLELPPFHFPTPKQLIPDPTFLSPDRHLGLWKLEDILSKGTNDLQNYPNNTSYVLILSLYNEKKIERCNEYFTCLQKNINHPLINEILVLYDSGKDSVNTNPVYSFLVNNPKITVGHIKGRPSFNFLFQAANQKYPNRSIIVANADIYFNNSLNLLQHYDLSNKFLALNRWDVLPNGSLELFRRFNGKPLYLSRSQDAWIFKTPLKTIPGADNVFMGRLRCDGRLAYLAQHAGLHVRNPCNDIQCCHLHLSEIRNEDRNEKIYGKIAALRFEGIFNDKDVTRARPTTKK